MRTVIQPASAGARSRLAIALLPGTYSEPEDFLREGFAAAVGERGIEAEVVMAELRAAWFADGSIVERIRSHVIDPARARGASRIWLGGISLGALASLGYAARHEDDLEGVVLISPYPATREVLRELEAAGGPRDWMHANVAHDDLEREAWRWLAATRAEAPAVHCYFATGDRFAAGQRLMAQVSAHAWQLQGGAHDWPTWKRLWHEFLSRSATALQ